MSAEVTEETPDIYDTKELSAKYDKIISFMDGQYSVLDKVIKHMDDVDRRLKKIEDKFA